MRYYSINVLFTLTIILSFTFNVLGQNKENDTTEVVIENIQPFLTYSEADSVSNAYMELILDSTLHIKDLSALPDSLACNFPGYPMYTSWDNQRVHYPMEDFSKMGDTLELIFNDTIINNYFHPINGRVTSRYGWRRSRFHSGIDVDLEYKDSVLCAFDGVVRLVKYHRGYGNMVVVRHYNGLETYYAHLTKGLVKTNQRVKAGELLGLGGKTGRAYGTHLHFEVRFLGAHMNPENLIDFTAFELKNDELALNSSNFKFIGKKPAATSTYAASTNGVHVVRPGDTLYDIAIRYRTSIDKLCALNNISRTTVLQIGWKIKVR